MPNAFDKLVDIMNELRGPDGCPWDKDQTHHSLKPYLLEEAYEVLEALDNQDFTHLKEELGDLMLQAVFHAQLAKENGHFDIYDVIQSLNEKLTRRHPHVFEDIEINSAEEQITHWEQIKKAEGKKSAIDGVPDTAPALLRAARMQQKAATVGFDWPDISPVWDKVTEEMDELQSAVARNNAEAIHEELGDLLFATVNLARFIKTNPEDALRNATDKFKRRFQQVESELEKTGKDIRKSSLEEMDAIWNNIKQQEKRQS